MITSHWLIIDIFIERAITLCVVYVCDRYFTFLVYNLIMIIRMLMSICAMQA